LEGEVSEGAIDGTFRTVRFGVSMVRMLGLRASKAPTSGSTGNRRVANDVYVDDGV
jgi:hypothetical protein